MPERRITLAALAHDVAEHKRECLTIRKETVSKLDKLNDRFDDLNKMGWKFIGAVAFIVSSALATVAVQNYLGQERVAQAAQVAAQAATNDTNDRRKHDAFIENKLEKIAPGQ